MQAIASGRNEAPLRTGTMTLTSGCCVRAGAVPADADGSDAPDKSDFMAAGTGARSGPSSRRKAGRPAMSRSTNSSVWRPAWGSCVRLAKPAVCAIGNSPIGLSADSGRSTVTGITAAFRARERAILPPAILP